MNHDDAMTSGGAVTALTTDLIFATKVVSTGRTFGIDVAIVRTVQEVTRRLEVEQHALVIIDLNASGVNVREALQATRTVEPPPRTVAYVSHVQTDLAAAARDAGADEVLPRSAFSARLPALFAEPGGSRLRTNPGRPGNRIVR